MWRASLSIFCLTAFLSTSAFSEPVSEALVRARFGNFSNELKGSSKLTIVRGGGTASKPSGEVQIDLDELADRLSKIPAAGWTESIDFVIAHELWHQQQFKKYRGKNFWQEDATTSRLYECHADLLATSTVMSNQQTLDKESFIRLKSVVDIVVGAGVTVHAGTSHPSPWQRRAAVQYGLSATMLKENKLNSFFDVLRDIGAPSTLIGTTKPNESDLALITRRALDYSEGSSLEEWALSTCKQIVHHDGEAIKSVSVGNATINWNKSSENPIVTYTIPYTNNSQRPLRLTGAIQTVLISRSAPNDISKQMVFAVNPLNLHLAPSATATISGTLLWYGDADFYPRLAYSPNGEHSMMAAAFMGSEDAKPASQCLGYMPKNITPLAHELRSALTKLAGAASAQFVDFQLGAGNRADDSISYPSSEKIPGNSDTIIEIERTGAASVISELYAGTSEAEAKRVYLDYRDAIISICPLVGINISERTTNELSKLHLPFSSRTELRLNSRKSSKTGKYYVDLTLQSVNW